MSARALGDAHDEPATGKPPCDFCRREVPCECGGEDCMCTCGRCMAPYPWESSAWRATLPGMAGFTLTRLDVFPPTTSVEAHNATAERVGAAPDGAAVDTQSMDAAAGATFTGLTAGAAYVAYALVGSEHRYVRFRADAVALAETAHALNSTFDDTEVEAALDALGETLNDVVAALQARGVM